MKEYSIITPVYNRLEYTIRCIDAAKRMNPDTDYEHIIVDNGSWDGTTDWVKSIADLDTDWWKQIVYVRLKDNVGDHKAKGTGLDYASGKYICMLDNDIEIASSNFLNRMRSLYDKVKDCGALGAKRRGVRIVIKPEESTTVDAQIYGDYLDMEKFTVGPVWYVPMPFYSKDRIKNKLINGWPKQLPKGLKVYKVAELYVNHMDDGTMKEQGYNWGDQRHKYPNYFSSKERVDNEFGKDMVCKWKN